MPEGRRRRSRILAPQARLAALLGAREAALASEELTLRARSDVDLGRPREAALQLLVALDAALAELAADPLAGVLAERLSELRGQREPVAAAAQAALSGPLSPEHADGGASSRWAGWRPRSEPGRRPPRGSAPSRARPTPSPRAPAIASISSSTSPRQRPAARSSYGVEPCVMIAILPPASSVICGNWATG